MNEKYIKYFLSIVFLLSGIGKLIDTSAAEKFLNFIFNDLVIIKNNSQLIIILISIVEIIIAILLSFHNNKIWLKIFIAIVSIFTISLLYIYFSHEWIPSCGCFGIFLEDGSPIIPIVRNFILILISLYVLLYSKPKD